MTQRFTLSHISDILEGTLHGEGSEHVTRLCIDSRSITQTIGTLFIALHGERQDGHSYIPDAIERGVRLFMVSDLSGLPMTDGVSYCLVNDTLHALQLLARHKRMQFKGDVCGIAGSNGKTIVKEWIYQCLRDSRNIVRSPKSFNSQVGVPLSAWMMDNEFDIAILEAGISKPGEMQRLEEIICPDIGVLTNIGAAHQENFLDMSEKLSEKLQLFKRSKKLIFRSDILVDGKPISAFLGGFSCEKISWTLDWSADTDAYAAVTNHHTRYLEPERGRYNFKIEKRDPRSTSICIEEENDFLISIPFTDNASIENALHVLVFMKEMGYTSSISAERIGIIEPVSMRLELLKGVFGSILINDSYNADLGGLASALNLLAQQEPSREKMVILSDLLQSGREKTALYSEIAELIKLAKVSQFIGIGPDLLASRDLFPERSTFYTNTSEFLSRFNKADLRDKVLLIKGSRIFRFEMITKELQKQVHQTFLMIDLNAMIHNLNYYRSLLKPEVRTMVVVKALSYGSGSHEIASLLQFHKVDYLAVAFVDEGITLRKAGVYLPIMVLNPDPSGYAAMVEYRLEPEIFSAEGLWAMLNLLKYTGERNYPVHIELDTGMHRLGFQAEDAEIILQAAKTGQIRITSIFSHLAASDDRAHDAFTRQQIFEFETFVSNLSKKLGYTPLRHILNTSGLERFPDAQFDMVRIGIGLHGVSENPELIPVSTFCTHVSQVRKVRDGDSVGYSRSAMVSGEREIAVIPVGYADGLSRLLSNGRGKVWIRSTFVPVIGNICMDMTMIDVTGLGVIVGDRVEIFGKKQKVMNLATQLGTIPYELLTGISERVKRIYIQE